MATRRVAMGLEQLGPARWVPLPPTPATWRTAVVCVYREVNAARVAKLLAALPPTAEIRLWALDRPAAALERHTVGAGPGGRLLHLDTLVAGLASEADTLVVADDDVEFVSGDLPRLVQAGISLDLDLFQPAHAAGSATAFPFVRARPFAFARRTRFVEQGPVVALSVRARRALFPLPTELGMGWGIEARWAAAAAEHGLGMGIVDAVTIRHVGAPGHSYDTAPELEQLRRELGARGLSDLRDLHTGARRIGPVAAWRSARRGTRTRPHTGHPESSA